MEDVQHLDLVAAPRRNFRADRKSSSLRKSLITSTSPRAGRRERHLERLQDLGGASRVERGSAPRGGRSSRSCLRTSTARASRARARAGPNRGAPARCSRAPPRNGAPGDLLLIGSAHRRAAVEQDREARRLLGFELLRPAARRAAGTRSSRGSRGSSPLAYSRCPRKCMPGPRRFIGRSPRRSADSMRRTFSSSLPSRTRNAGSSRVLRGFRHRRFWALIESK